MKAKKKAAAIPTSADDPATTRNQSVADAHTKGNKSTAKDDRIRTFACIIYLDSAPADWKEIISSWHIEAFVSPLHDKDVNPGGEPKKPHHHVMLMFDGKKSDDRVKELFSEISGVGFERVNSTRGMARYLCHLDNPEKYQYDVGDVMQFAGADYQTIIGLPSDKYGTLMEMLDFIEANNVYSFSELLRWCGSHNSKWFRALSDNCAYIVKEYLSSRQYSHERGWVDRSANWTMEGERGGAPDSGNPGAEAEASEVDPE